MPSINKFPSLQISKQSETDSKLTIEVEPIVIELTINVNSDNISVKQKEEKEEEKPDWQIPNFSSNKINFGKN